MFLKILFVNQLTAGEYHNMVSVHNNYKNVLVIMI